MRAAAQVVLALAVACKLVLTVAWAAAPPASDLDVLRGSAQDKGFALATQPRAFEFPRDHGPHPEFRQEWWYVTGNLDSASGERYGFELTFFRVALVPATDAAPKSDSTPVSGWRTRQLYVAHFAITDAARGQFHFTQKFSRDALGLAGAQAQPFRVWLDDWLLGTQPTVPGPAPNWTLHAQGAGYELTLELEPLSQPVLNGAGGLFRSSDEASAASYYYSIPRMAVHGQLARGAAASDVKGLAWFDREWGTGSLGASEQGWEWFALQLQDGSALMFYALRDFDGTRDLHSTGTWVDPSGRVQLLASGQVDIEVRDHWKSPSGGRYPSSWRLRAPAVGLDVEIRPVLADQELLTQPRYWEGAVDVRGTREGHDTSGRGYVELVGYGE